MQGGFPGAETCCEGAGDEVGPFEEGKGGFGVDDVGGLGLLRGGKAGECDVGFLLDGLGFCGEGGGEEGGEVGHESIGDFLWERENVDQNRVEIESMASCIFLDEEICRG